jgi:hypothetical protein
VDTYRERVRASPEAASDAVLRGGAEVMLHIASHWGGGGLAKHVDIVLPTCAQCAHRRRRAKHLVTLSIVLFFATLVGAIVLIGALVPSDPADAAESLNTAVGLLFVAWGLSTAGWIGLAVYRRFLRSRMYVSYVGHKGIYYTFALRSTAQDFADRHGGRVEHRPIVFELY